VTIPVWQWTCTAAPLFYILSEMIFLAWTSPPPIILLTDGWVL